MRHTPRIAAQGLPPHGRDPRPERGWDQVTGSIEPVSADVPDQDQRIAQVRDAVFPLALRGYDREAVDAYVKRVNRLVTDLEASRSPEAAIRRALDQVGEETSGILQRAQQTANEITERSRGSADDRIREAERQARAMTEDAEDRVRELEADYGAIWARRDRLLDEVRDLAERLLATADDAADRLPTQDEEAEVVDSPRADTASFPQLEPGDEDTTVSAAFDVSSAADFGESSSDGPGDFDPPEPVAVDPAGVGSDDERDRRAPSGPPVAGASRAGEHSYEFRRSDDIDFVDQLGDDEPERRDPDEDLPPEVRSP
ncbi:MAG: hypothetical protein AVDCRST_MAG45-1203 [uncultured Solirubrobacterales bacterium]|uniref:Cell wall synthesis protein Wag31 n=1 Tax=uncultured Solirubrobacterales bacterium TaxID=768556 RepID=A0A6J4SNK4_9ACTN|nr:MAG: hypothetical protein AVDCRST_MAG45-1203 [uncultured Solirubrobacterales bacterium]